MSFKCAITGKGPRAGNSISHSHKASKRRFMPNLQNIKVLVDGKVQTLKVSTHAIKAGMITKAPKRNWKPVTAAAK
jgi:large subunit ribosomal protein L28